MSNPQTTTPPGSCFSCSNMIERPSYCATCVAEQLRELERERVAFDAFHRFADRVARQSHAGR